MQKKGDYLTNPYRRYSDYTSNSNISNLSRTDFRFLHPVHKKLHDR